MHTAETPKPYSPFGPAFQLYRKKEAVEAFRVDEDTYANFLSHPRISKPTGDQVFYGEELYDVKGTLLMVLTPQDILMHVGVGYYLIFQGKYDTWTLPAWKFEQNYKQLASGENLYFKKDPVEGRRYALADAKELIAAGAPIAWTHREELEEQECESQLHDAPSDKMEASGKEETYCVKAFEGLVPLEEGDWILRDLDNTGYRRMKDDLFRRIYEEVPA